MFLLKKQTFVKSFKIETLTMHSFVEKYLELIYILFSSHCSRIPTFSYVVDDYILVS